MTVKELLIKFQEYQLEFNVLNANCAHNAAANLFMERNAVENCTIHDVSNRLSEMEEAGKEATSLIAHLKDQHGFNEVEEEAQNKIMKVFKYEGRW